MTAHSRPPRVLASEIDGWRSAMLRSLPQRGVATTRAAVTLENLERGLRRAARLLHGQYRTPHLGNWRDPTAEFVFIVLSRRTAERAYLPAFQALQGLGGWDHVANLSAAEIAVLILGCGLEGKKALALSGGLLTIRERLGACDLSRAGDQEDSGLYEFLSTLPEIGPKSALCVMLYSFGRAVFPVDAHVGRILARLGVLATILPGLSMMDHKKRQRVLLDPVPPDLRYSLHVNLICHGRTMCHAIAPKCGKCFLRDECQYPHSAQLARPHDPRLNRSGFTQ